MVGWSNGRVVGWSNGRAVEWSNQGPPDHLTKDHLTILVVKLSDIGDVLTATPALRALRESFPAARLEALVPPNSAPVLTESPLVDGVIVFDKFQYDRPIDVLKPSSLAALVRFARDLSRQRYDCLVILHHLTTRWGTLKYAALALASGAKVRAGLDNGRGWFLTHRARDGGFGARHEVEYWLDVVALLGAKTDDLSLEMIVGKNDQIPMTNARSLRFILVRVATVWPGDGRRRDSPRWPTHWSSVTAHASPWWAPPPMVSPRLPR